MNKLIFLFLFYFTSIWTFSQNEMLIKAYIAIQYRDTNTAIKLFNELIEKNFYTNISLQELSSIYYKQKKFNEAIRTNFKLLRYDSSASLQIALAYGMQKNTDSCLFWLKQYLKLRNKLPENKLRTHPAFNFLNNDKQWNDLWKQSWFDEFENRIAEIEYLYDRKEINDLIDLVDNSLQQYPNNSTLLLWRARAYLAGQNTKEAMRSIDQIIKSKTLLVDAYLLKAQILETHKKFKLLAEIYEQLFHLQPYKIQWLSMATMNYNYAEDYKKSYECALQYLRYDTLSDKMYYQTGIACKNINKLEDAISYFSKAISLNSGNSEYYYERSACYYELNRYEDAFGDICMAMDLKAMQGKYFFQRALIYHAMKNALAACRDFEKAKQWGYIKAESYIQRYCKGK
ncbi:MAG: tetratricopeptide repeat protein [Bacteroidales bacterium]|nr:tetratricopeptide repeat protein [Bacteroidales bacterium]